MPAGFDLVVAAPENHARMIAQTHDLLDCFLAHVILKRSVAGDHVSAKHEFLPDHNSEFVADVEEIVGFVIASAPLADHIHVRVPSRPKNSAVRLGRYAIREAVERNDIGAFGEDKNTIHNELKTLPPRIRHAAQFDRRHTGLDLRMRGHIVADAERRGKTITALRSVSNWKPQLGIRDAD